VSTIEDLVQIVDEYLVETYGDFAEGVDDSHPILFPKDSKIIHDSLWGTNRFYWYEMAIIDSPVLQRLRDIFQVGSASYVYPGATHNRFEHSLGTAIIATKVLDSLYLRQGEKIGHIAKSLGYLPEKFMIKTRQELRLSALLHDTGHTLFSHTSEPSHLKINLLKKATEEVSALVAKERSSGETLSYCIARSNFVKDIIQRNKRNIPPDKSDMYNEFMADMDNVALMILGKTKDKFTQFIADILTSGFDSDKLDYLLRDGISAGLPVKYDLDRYMEFVAVEEEERKIGADEEVDSIKKLYGEDVEIGDIWEEYRLRIPQSAITSMEQIIIGKFMLFGYIYHHPKVRATDSYIDLTLRHTLEEFQTKGLNDKQLVKWLLSLTDSVFRSIPTFKNTIKNETTFSDNLAKCAYRLETRTLPREVFSVNGSAVSHVSRDNIVKFFVKFQDPDKKEEEIKSVEDKIRKELNDEEVEFWIDFPKPPSFEDVKRMVGKVPLLYIFPIDRWTEAYMHYTYKMRIFTFSKYFAKLHIALSKTLPEILGLENTVVQNLMRKR
jgi:HD superfamily phosphohydrolase